jgi:amino acid adenylation domain-containing protein/non-ribosomal peptide synthase protein (TIGR01720 family)
VNNRSTGDLYSLTSVQRVIWLDQKFGSESPVYNIGGYLEIQARIDREIFGSALDRLVAECDALRTVIVEQEGVPYQYFTPHSTVASGYEDFSGIADPAGEAQKWMEEQTRIPLLLDGGPLYLFCLIRVEEDRYFWYFKFHHLIIDGWSISLLVKRLSVLYTAMSAGEPVSATGVSSYVNCIRQDQEYTKSPSFLADEKYWLEKYSSLPQPLSFLKEFGNPSESRFPSSRRTFTINSAEYKKSLSHLSATGVSGFHLFLGLLYTYFSRLHGQRDLVIGIPVLNRSGIIHKNTVGLYTSVMPLRLSFGDDITFADLLIGIKNELRQSFRYQKYPVDELYSKIKLHASGEKALFNITLSYQEHDYTAFFNGSRSIIHSLPNFHEQSVLAVQVGKYYEDSDVSVDLDHSNKIWGSRSAELLEERFRHLLRDIPSLCGQRLKDIELVTPSERKLLISGFNQTRLSFGEGSLIHELFEEQVRRNPGHTAVVFGGQELSYEALNKRANQLAATLRENGAGPGALIGVVCERSPEMIITLLGILKSGAAYVPVETYFPVARIQKIFSSLEIRHIVATGSCMHLVDELCKDMPSLRNVYLTDLSEAPGSAAGGTVAFHTAPDIKARNSSNLLRLNTSSDLAYIIFTSGSTGTPKGVVIQHRPVINLIEWVNSTFGVGPTDRLLFVTSICFDLSVYDIFGILAAGATIHMATREDIANPDSLAEILEKEPVTFWDSAPAVLQQLASYLENEKERFRQSPLRLVFLSGDWIPVSLPGKVKETFRKSRVVSLGGATEATIWSNWYPVGDVYPDWPSIPYGKPIQNARYYILDGNLSPCPAGIPGDLYIGGECLAAGYANDPALSSAKFLEDPFFGDGSHRMYKTGDLARWHSDGNMEFLGRADLQVKIRGYRIELGEIESRLNAHPLIKEAVVTDKQETVGGASHKYLCAYYTGETELDPSDLRGFLATELPDYMIPSYFIRIEKIPLTSNGKLDRKALPDPATGSASVDQYVAPSGNTEKTLADLWQDVLCIERAGVNDNFFLSGGHSLKATVLAAKIQKAFNVRITLKELFDNPTVKAQARLIKAAAPDVFTSIRPVQKKDYYDVSPAQKRVWVMSQMQESSLAYNMPGAFMLYGNLDEACFERAVKKLIERHESLRTVFPSFEGEPRQRIVAAEQLGFMLQTEAPGDIKDEEEVVRERLLAESNTPFDLENGPLLRVRLLRLGTEKQAVIFNMHHIISDGWSTEVLLKELVKFYNSYTGGKEAVPGELPVQYRDYSEWQQEMLNSTEVERLRKYWLSSMGGNLPVLELPEARPRPGIQTFTGGLAEMQIDLQTAERFRALCGQYNATLFMGFLSVTKLLLGRYSGQDDIIIGTPAAGREHQDLHEQIGLYVNTIPLRTKIDQRLSFAAFLQTVRDSTKEAYDHQQYPLDRLLADLRPVRNPGRSPLFDVMFMMENVDPAEALSGMNGVRAEWVNAERPFTKFDLTVNLIEKAGSFKLSLEYNRDIYDLWQIRNFGNHFINLLQAVLEDPGAPVYGLSYLSAGEKDLLTVSFNDTDRSYPNHSTVIDLFHEQVRRTPGQTALMEGEEKYTYAELWAKTNAVSESLNISRGELVGIISDPCMEAVVAMLSVLKAGGAYVPIDPEYPAARKEFMVRDSGMTTALIPSRLAHKEEKLLDLFDKERIFILERGKVPAGKATINPVPGPDDDCYIIYTSGTTGNPKGVVVQHRGLTNYVCWAARQYVKEEKISFPLYTSLAFDLTVTSVFVPLVTGNAIVVYRGEMQEVIEEIFTDGRAGAVKLTPSHLRLIRGKKFKGSAVKRLIVGGENLESSLAETVRESFGSKPEILNEYGPTEAVVGCMIHSYNPEKDTRIYVPIGKPADNVGIYLLDAGMQPVGTGVAGEIYISGDGVARGYLNRAELTAERFLPDPFRPGRRMYKTGDSARFLPDGVLEFISRKDTQVKLRGYRIELGEVEHALQGCRGIREAVVSVAGSGDKRFLAAYLVKDGDVSEETVKEYLLGILPEYMVPQAYVWLDSVPLTDNGKTDRARLPDPGSVNTEKRYAAPVSETQKRMAEVWEEVLGVKGPGIYDNFFHLGGDSIKAIQVVARLRKYRIKIDVKTLLTYSTIDQLSLHAGITRNTAEEESSVGEIPLSPVQCWFFEQDIPHRHHWNQSAMLFSKTRLDRELLDKAIGKLVEHHEGLRMGYSSGPDGSITQYLHAYEGARPLAFHDLSAEENAEEKIEKTASTIQREIDLKEPPLLRSALFRTREGDHLLLVIHHLVVDGISWRVLLDDLDSAYRSLIGGQEPVLPEKSASYGKWVSLIRKYANSNDLLRQLPYWRNVMEVETDALPAGRPVEADLVKDEDSVSLSLSRDLTEKLLGPANEAFGTGINDILLTALSLAFKDWAGMSKVLIMLEGHGREPVHPDEDIDISRTVGWFTSFFPFVLSVPSDDPGECLKDTKERLRKVPGKGAGYNILRYCTERDLVKEIDFTDSPVGFNYLGSFGSEGSGLLSFSNIPSGKMTDEESARQHSIGFTGMVMAGELSFRIGFNRHRYEREFMEELASFYRIRLEKITDFCLHRGKEYTPSDFGDTDLTAEELELIMGKINT